MGFWRNIQDTEVCDNVYAGASDLRFIFFFFFMAIRLLQRGSMTTSVPELSAFHEIREGSSKKASLYIC